jgi:hypothetical protein
VREEACLVVVAGLGEHRQHDGHFVQLQRKNESITMVRQIANTATNTPPTLNRTALASSLLTSFFSDSRFRIGT